MDISPLTPNDPRTIWDEAIIRGYTYSYQVIAPPPATAIKDTILLLHGFPDLSYGWRKQAPFLASLGYRVVIPDMLGYGRSSAPEEPAEYSLKKISDDMKSLINHITTLTPGTSPLGSPVGSDHNMDLGAPDKSPEQHKVILGGHDWGGALAWRICLWHPDIVKAVFVACTPYWPPSPSSMGYHDLKELVQNGTLPSFGYQLQFAALPPTPSPLPSPASSHHSYDHEDDYDSSQDYFSSAAPSDAEDSGGDDKDDNRATRSRSVLSRSNSVSSCCSRKRKIPRKIMAALETAIEKRSIVINRSGGIQEDIENYPDRLKCFLRTMYGGRTTQGSSPFAVTHGIALEAYLGVGPSKLLSPEDEEFMVQEYGRSGIRGPLNWYRTRKVNFDEERELAHLGQIRVQCPTLFVRAERDEALPPSLGQGMEQWFEGGDKGTGIGGLVEKKVDAGHWVLLEKPDEVNGILREWLGGVGKLFGQEETEGGKRKEKANAKL